MIISTDVENAFDLSLFMTKIHSKLGMEGNFINLRVSPKNYSEQYIQW